MDFEFDPRKSETNKHKHGVTLQQATQIWLEAYLEITANTVGEPQLMAIGQIGGKLHACIYTVRGQAVRLISCRRARAKEAQLYHDHFKETPRET